jgi:hypothetical protein
LRICEEHRIAQYHGQALCADGWAIGVSGESEKGLAQIGQGVDGHGLGGILVWPAISPPSSPTISLQPAATITGISAMPSCRAASILAWPAISPPSSPTSAGFVQPHSLMLVQPHSLMLAAIAAIWASVWVRAFLAYGISRSIAHRSTLSAGHGL